MKLGVKSRPTMLFIYAFLLHPEKLGGAGITGATGSCIPAKAPGYCVELEDGGGKARLVEASKAECKGEATGIICSATMEASEHLREGNRFRVRVEPVLAGLPAVEAEALEREEAGEPGSAQRLLEEAVSFWDEAFPGFKLDYIKGLTRA